MNYWFTGDHHFYHNNIRIHAKRPFDSEPEMRASLIEAWNAVVAPKDEVRHVGDFAWTDKIELVEELIRQLNGKIHIVYGNHDTKKGVKRAKGFASAERADEIEVLLPNGEKQFIYLHHYSCEVWNKSHWGSWHLYGHSHDSLAPNLTRRSFDVGIDAVAARLAFAAGREKQAMDYRPMNFDEVAD